MAQKQISRFPLNEKLSGLSGHVPNYECWEFCLIELGLFCLVLFVVVMLEVLLDRTGFVLFGFICGCSVGSSA